MDRLDSRSGVTNRFERNEGKRLNMTNLFCNYCKKPGHTIEKCYRLHGFPPNNKYKGTRRMAALVQVDGQEEASGANGYCNNMSSSDFAVPGLTTEQSA